MLSSVDWSITTGENGRSVLGSGTASGAQLSDKFVSSNQYGYNIDVATATIAPVAVVTGATYWLNLQNAVVPSGDPVYWDENSGKGCGGVGCPSSASESAVGTIPGEAFTTYNAVGPRGARLSPAASCCLVLAFWAWLACCAASCSKQINQPSPRLRTTRKPERKLRPFIAGRKFHGAERGQPMAREAAHQALAT